MRAALVRRRVHSHRVAIAVVNLCFLAPIAVSAVCARLVLHIGWSSAIASSAVDCIGVSLSLAVIAIYYFFAVSDSTRPWDSKVVNQYVEERYVYTRDGRRIGHTMR